MRRLPSFSRWSEFARRHQLDLEEPDTPLIEWSLGMAERLKMQAVLVVREEKVDLLEYLQNRDVDTVVISSSQEWPESILKAKDRWADYNLVLLPDTRFAPADVLFKMRDDLRGPYDLSFACHPVKSFATWGVVAEHEDCFWEAEKPQKMISLSSVVYHAWGVFGFSQRVGSELLSGMLASCFDHEWRRLPQQVSIHQLWAFEDLTREPILKS